MTDSETSLDLACQSRLGWLTGGSRSRLKAQFLKPDVLLQLRPGLIDDFDLRLEVLNAFDPVAVFCARILATGDDKSLCVTAGGALARYLVADVSNRPATAWQRASVKERYVAMAESAKRVL